MPIKDHKAVEAFHKGKKVRGIYRRELGAFQTKKGALKITASEYEYSFDYTVDGKRYRSVFGKESEFGKIGSSGRWESHALEQAVETLLRFKNNAAVGVGPTSIKEELRLSRREAEEKKRQQAREKTVEDLIELFLEDIAREAPGIKPNKPRTIREYSLNLYRDVVPSIGKRKAKDIEREDISEIIDTIVARGTFIQANRTLSACSRLFNWALSKGRVRYNPCAQMKKYEEKPRIRVLTEPERKNVSNNKPRHNEIKILWDKLVEASTQVEARVLLLCLLLGSRPGEICHMRWEDIDEDNWWSLDDTKVEVTLDCYLTPTARNLLSRKKRSGPVFPMAKKKDNAIPVDRLSDFVRENDYFGLKVWQPRDLRRTFTTLSTGLGFDHFIINMGQARKNSSVIREHYDKRRYYSELRKLFETVEQEVLRIITQPNGSQDLEA